MVTNNCKDAAEAFMKAVVEDSTANSLVLSKEIANNTKNTSNIVKDIGQSFDMKLATTTKQLEDIKTNLHPLVQLKKDMSSIRGLIKSQIILQRKEMKLIESQIKLHRIETALHQLEHVNTKHFYYYGPNGFCSSKFLISDILLTFRKATTAPGVGDGTGSYNISKCYIDTKDRREFCEGFREKLVRHLHDLLGHKPRLEPLNDGQWHIHYS